MIVPFASASGGSECGRAPPAPPDGVEDLCTADNLRRCNIPCRQSSTGRCVSDRVANRHSLVQVAG